MDPTSILILEDNPGDVELLTDLLDTLGYDTSKIVVVGKLRDAIEALYEMHFDIALADLGLPDAEGVDIIKQIAETVPSLPIVVVSGNESIEDSLAVGAQEVVRKDDMDSLLPGAIRRAVLRKKADQNVRYRATHDGMTGLYNRSHFLEMVDRALSRNQRYSTGCGIIYIDLDKFKPINDKYGHHEGDRVLKMIADKILKSTRDGDIAGRLGGDEFGVLVEDVRDYETMRILARRVLIVLGEPLALDNGTVVTINGSIGVAMTVGDRNTLTAYDFLKAADSAMFEAKSTGGNQYMFAAEHGRPRESDLSLELAEALKKDEFFLVYQPQLSLSTSTMIGVEALLRWNRKSGPRIGPDVFVPILEQSGRIVGIGSWVLKEAMTTAAALMKKSKVKVRMAVNISPQQLEKEGFADYVKSLLQELQYPPELLELEITETILMKNSDRTDQTLLAVRNLGVRIVVDDFGTGFASLSYLLKYPVDGIKIDRSFITPLPKAKAAGVLVTSVIDLAHQLGVDVIAEGVETQEQVQFLTDKGCDLGQGYLFGRPYFLTVEDGEVRQVVQDV